MQQEQYQAIVKSIQEGREALQEQFSGMVLDEPTIVGKLLQKISAAQPTQSLPSMKNGSCRKS